MEASELLDTFAQMTLLELSDFVKQFEDRFGVTAYAPPAPATPGDVAPVAVEEEQDEFDVILDSFGTAKIQVIKQVRVLTSLGLSDAKAFVEALPKPLAERVTKDEALKIKAEFEAAGAVVTVR